MEGADVRWSGAESQSAFGYSLHGHIWGTSPSGRSSHLNPLGCKRGASSRVSIA